MEESWRKFGRDVKRTPSVGLQTTEVLETSGVCKYNAHIMGNHNKTWYVYLLECADGTLYTGISLDPERRAKQHNAGRAARYTRTRLPVRLLGSVTVQGRVEALRLEKRIKGWRPQRKRAFFAKSGAACNGSHNKSGGE
jgi:putative endonuclease